MQGGKFSEEGDRENRDECYTHEDSTIEEGGTVTDQILRVHILHHCCQLGGGMEERGGEGRGGMEERGGERWRRGEGRG